MDINTQEKNGITIVNIVGRVDAVTAADFESKCKTLIDDGATKLLLNFKDVDYISSAGLRAVLIILKITKSSKITMAFCSLQDMVAEVFKVSGFTAMLSIYEQEDEALLSFD